LNSDVAHSRHEEALLKGTKKIGETCKERNRISTIVCKQKMISKVNSGVLEYKWCAS